MSKPFLISEQLMHYYLHRHSSENVPGPLPDELERERKAALVKASREDITRIKSSIFKLMHKEVCEDCTAVIRQNLAQLTEEISDIRQCTLSNILNKYVKTKADIEEDNLFIEYMKRQVCAELPCLSNLLDIVYKKHNNTKISDRLDAINEAVYDAFLEYLSTPNLLIPNNRNSRIKGERVSCYNANSIDTAGPDLCLKNNLKNNNITVACISKPEVMAPKAYQRIWPETAWPAYKFLNWILTEEQELNVHSPDSLTDIHLADVEGYRNVSLQLDYTVSSNISFEGNMRASCASVDYSPSYIVQTYVATELLDRDFCVRVGLHKYLPSDMTRYNSEAHVSAEEFMNGDLCSKDNALMLDTLGTELNDIVHTLIRRDHALEDIIDVFIQLLSTEVPLDKESEGDVFVFGHPASHSVRDKIVKVVMAAIVAPVKKTASGFTAAPDIATIVTLSGIPEAEAIYYLYRFAFAFGLEFMESQVYTSTNGVSYYMDRLKPREMTQRLFSSSRGSDSSLFESQHNRCYADVIKPRIKQKVVECICARHRISSEDLAKAVRLSADEAIVLSSEFLIRSIIKPALAFYMAIMESLVYIVGFKAASLLPYKIESELHKQGLSPSVKLKSILYGMGSGLIHAVFEQKGTWDPCLPDVAIPISQYIMPDITSSDSDAMVRIYRYIEGVMLNVKLLFYYLNKNGKILGRCIPGFLSCPESSHKQTLDIIRSLPDFKTIRTLYVNDPDCINSFAPGFRGVFKAGDRALLEAKLAEAREKLEELYYVISARRPLVPEEYIEDPTYQISMHTDADRMNINPDMLNTLYAEVRPAFSIFYDKASANPDIDVLSLDARGLALRDSINTNSDAMDDAVVTRKYILMGNEDASHTIENAVALYGYPAGIVHSLLPNAKSLAIKGRRRGYPLIGLFMESEKWSLANKRDRYYVGCPLQQLYQVTDRRSVGNRLPILAISEFFGQDMLRDSTNGFLNSASDKYISATGSEIDLFVGINNIPNQVLRLTTDSAFLPPYSNYRFLEAVRRRWIPEKYPKYLSFSYARRVDISQDMGRNKSPYPYNINVWQLGGDIRGLDIQRTSEFISMQRSPLDYSVGEIERACEKRRAQTIENAEKGVAEKDVEKRSWSQLWLETVLDQTNINQSNDSRRNSLNPYSYDIPYIRHIALSLSPEYRQSEKLVLQTLADTEDISRSLNIYMELYDAEDTTMSHRKARMRLISLLILRMTCPCTEGFLDAINERILDTEDEEDENTVDSQQYNAVCKTRELTEIASEIKVNVTKSDIDREIRELRRQKEEYCKAYRDYMQTLKKQRKSLRDGRCFLNNADAFTEEEKGIDSLYKAGQILGYRLICRDKCDLSGSPDGTNVLLDTREFIANKDVILKRIANHEISIDMVALTAPVYIWAGAFIFSIGKVTINIRDVFDMRNIKPKFYNEDQSLLAKYTKVGIDRKEISRTISDNISIDAPHVRDHKACVGNLEKNLNDAATAEDILAYLEWCLVYLSTVKLGDPYGSVLSSFPCVPATLHNVIKYGVLDSGRLDDRICLWTGAGLKKDEIGISPCSTITVQPVWNIGDDLISALWKDSKAKLENNSYEGSDILEEELIPIATELSGEPLSSPVDENRAHKVYRNILSYSMFKDVQSMEPESTLRDTSNYVADPDHMCSSLRAGLRQKLEHRDYYRQKSWRFMEFVMNSGRSFSKMWNKNGVDDALKLNLETVKDNRLASYRLVI